MGFQKYKKSNYVHFLIKFGIPEADCVLFNK